LKQHTRIVRYNPDDHYALLTFANGKIEKQELNQGSSFLSQSSGFINIGDSVSAVSIINGKGIKKIFH